MIATMIQPASNLLFKAGNASIESTTNSVTASIDSEKATVDSVSPESAVTEPFATVTGLEKLRETLQNFFDQIFRDDVQRDEAVERVLSDLSQAREPVNPETDNFSASSFSLRLTNLQVDYQQEGEASSFQFSQTVLEVKQLQVEGSLPHLFDMAGLKVDMDREDLQKGNKFGFYSRRHVMRDQVAAGASLESYKEAMEQSKKVMEELKNFTFAMKDYRRTGNAEPLKFFFEQQA